MKSIKHICTLMSVASVAITTSCTDSFLEQDPLSFYEPSTTYNTESGLQAAMAVCDRHLRYHFINGNANNCPIATDYLFSEIGIYGKPDEWGNTYSKDNWDKQQGTEATGGSYWYQRCIKYSFYNRGITISSGRATALNYRMDKRNLFWPIPNSAITANNGARLAQNYGYDGYDPSVEMFSKWEDAVKDETGEK